ncbi:uncharacterized protein G2W53_037242 [Senna tora]|uniref:Uncharacterized protein n=1 Tax=Senna tora TaxID=362788 RepID=A0A834WAY1_9FABA|nr:uncharacterized protein G2W53_037242 [Senna tora]
MDANTQVISRKRKSNEEEEEDIIKIIIVRVMIPLMDTIAIWYHDKFVLLKNRRMIESSRDGVSSIVYVVDE